MATLPGKVHLPQSVQSRIRGGQINKRNMSVQGSQLRSILSLGYRLEPFAKSDEGGASAAVPVNTPFSSDRS